MLLCNMIDNPHHGETLQLFKQHRLSIIGRTDNLKAKEWPIKLVGRDDSLEQICFHSEFKFEIKALFGVPPKMDILMLLSR